jgi:hypothetical protein
MVRKRSQHTLRKKKSEQRRRSKSGRRSKSRRRSKSGRRSKSRRRSRSRTRRKQSGGKKKVSRRRRVSRKKVLKRRQRGGTNPVNVCVTKNNGSYTAKIGPCPSSFSFDEIQARAGGAAQRVAVAPQKNPKVPPSTGKSAAKQGEELLEYIDSMPSKKETVSPPPGVWLSQQDKEARATAEAAQQQEDKEWPDLATFEADNLSSTTRVGDRPYGEIEH